jgi:N-acetylneuraminic acid mutarotase
MYNPATDTWIRKGDMPQGIYTGCFTGVVDGKIYVVGGDGRGKRVDEYDPITDTWVQKSDMPTFTTDQSTCVLDEKIYVIGGETGPPPTYPGMTNVNLYDPAMDTWKTAYDMPTGRSGLRSSGVNGKIYVIGGLHYWGLKACRTVEVYDPSKN